MFHPESEEYQKASAKADKKRSGDFNTDDILYMDTHDD